MWFPETEAVSRFSKASAFIDANSVRTLILVKCMCRYSSICQIHQGWSIPVGKDCENNKDYWSGNSVVFLQWKHNKHPVLASTMANPCDFGTIEMSFTWMQMDKQEKTLELRKFVLYSSGSRWAL